MKSIVCCALALVACGCAVVNAADCCDHCDRCGCESACHKVCRVVCETKKVPKVTYSCECEDFCVPGPSDHCVVCDECGKKKHLYTPTCAQVRTRKKLVKHETVEEVPTHKWVVETVCDACACQSAVQSAPGTNAVTRLPLENGDVLKASFQRPAAAEVPSSSTARVPSTENPGLTAQLRRMLTPAFGQK